MITNKGNSNQLEFPGRQAKQGQRARTELFGVSGLSLKALLLCLGFLLPLLIDQVSALLSKSLITRTECESLSKSFSHYRKWQENIY